MLFKKSQIFLCSLICFTSWALASSPPDLEDEAQKTQTRYKDYKIDFIRYPNLAFGDKFSISHYGTELFNASGAVNLYDADNLKPIENIAYIKHPFIIVSEYSGGAHCCYSLYIISMDMQCKVLAEFSGGSNEVKIEKLFTEALNYRIKLSDEYSYDFGSFSTSPHPQVILHFNKDMYHVAIDEMRAPPLTSQELEKIIVDIKAQNYSNFKYKSPKIEAYQSNNEYFAKTLKVIFDLIYCGQSSQARELIDRTWPSDAASKLLFISDIQEILRKRDYYEALVELNKPYGILENLKSDD